MRVEVEVYNGPLARSIEAQEAELVAVIEHTAAAFRTLEHEMMLGQCRLGCFKGNHTIDTGNTCKVERTGSAPTVIPIPPPPPREERPATGPITAIGDFVRDIGAWWRSVLYPQIAEREKHLEQRKDDLDSKESGLKEKEYRLHKRLSERAAGETFYTFNVTAEDELVQACPVLHGLERDAKDIVTVATNIEKQTTNSNQVSEQPPSEGNRRRRTADIDLYRQAARLGHMLRSKGEFWATQNIGIVPDSTRTRIGLVHFTNGAAELGNEIAARADALVRQNSYNLQGWAVARELLPTSLYLRDSGGTDYLNLTDWFHASVKREGSFLTKEDRVRVIQRLITDTHWSKVNTVYASGQGEVRMALIKDDIGNWNLKSFDSDPTELLDAYKNLGLAAVSAVAGLASGGGRTDTLQSALGFANQVALGKASGTGAGLDVESIHGHTRTRLASLQDEQRRRANALNLQIGESERQVEAARGSGIMDSTALEAAKMARDKKNMEIEEALVELGKLVERRRKVEFDAKEAQKQIGGYERDIEALERQFRNFRDPIDHEIKRREGRISALEELGNQEAHEVEVASLKDKNIQAEKEISERMREKEKAVVELEGAIGVALERTDVQSTLTELDGQVTNQRTRVEDLRVELFELQASYDKAENAENLRQKEEEEKLAHLTKKIEELINERNGIPEETRRQAIIILSDHSGLITALQRRIVEERPGL